jgi:hypothetical protein
MGIGKEPTANLVEHGMKYFTSHTLRRCHDVRVKYEGSMRTIYTMLCVIVLFAAILFAKRVFRENDKEREERISKRNSYLYTKMRMFNHANDMQGRVNLYG